MQRDSTLNLIKDIIDKNQCISTVVAKACMVVPELGILEVELIDVRVWKLTAGVHDTQTELEKV